MTQTHRRDVKVEMEANEIQLILITFKEERPLPPSVKDKSLFRFNFFSFTFSCISVSAQSVYLSCIYHCVDNALC